MKISALKMLFLVMIISSCQKEITQYVCPPCDLPCDDLTFTKAGTCAHCGMELLPKQALIEESKLVANDIHIETGAGVFLLEGGPGKKEKHIKVYYHKPKNYSAQSAILLVIPGAGRDGDEYRDDWKEVAEQHSVLVLSPMYAEEDYPFEAYHLGGLITSSNLLSSVEFIEGTNIASLDEEKLSYTLTTQQQEWLFPDFDRLFQLVVQALESEQQQYDIFGHSAGGQILHRMALLYPESKVNHIIAANSGFYTLPDTATNFPFGIQDLSFRKKELQTSFQTSLTLLIGELDNEHETGGTLLRSPTVDQQGLHRLARGTYFFQFSQALASEMKVPYNWEIHIVPEVGHDHQKMSQAAAKLLYGEE